MWVCVSASSVKSESEKQNHRERERERSKRNTDKNSPRMDDPITTKTTIEREGERNDNNNNDNPISSWLLPETYRITPPLVPWRYDDGSSDKIMCVYVCACVYVSMCGDQSFV